MVTSRKIPVHRFALGESVAFTPTPSDGSAQGGVYTVVRHMPTNEDRDLQYRIRDPRDGHERMVRESQLGQV